MPNKIESRMMGLQDLKPDQKCWKAILSVASRILKIKNNRKTKTVETSVNYLMRQS
jgi:hypothetical protein